MTKEETAAINTSLEQIFLSEVMELGEKQNKKQNKTKQNKTNKQTKKPKT